MLGNQHLAELDDVLGLGAIEPDGADQVLDPRLTERHHLLRRVRELKQCGRRLVDAGVCRLRREDHGHEQCEGALELELAAGIGEPLGEPAEELLDVLRSHGRDDRGLLVKTKKGLSAGVAKATQRTRGSSSLTVAVVELPSLNSSASSA